LDGQKTGFFPPEACHIDRPTLRDPSLQAELEHRGYVVVQLLDEAGVAELVDGYDRIGAELGGPNEPGAYNDTYAEFSIIHSRPEFRRRAYDLITSTLVPVANTHLLDHRALIANFVNKPPGTGVVPAHQNFSVVDERRYRSVSVWVALVDCVLANGAMAMLDGSHARLRGCRGMWAYQSFSDIEQEIIDGFLHLVEVPRGGAVILDDALVHYSPPNLTDARRLAIQLVMVPEEAHPVWFQQVGETDGDAEVDVWQVDERFFFDFWHGDGDERYGVRTDHLRVEDTRLDVEALRELLGTSSPSAARGRRRHRGLRARISRLSR
jgi:ectoine hydroxylase-related dioxygenase (phytanoyl-CoA dioxygenase family)